MTSSNGAPTTTDIEEAEENSEESTEVKKDYGKYMQLCKEVVLNGQDSYSDFIVLMNQLFIDASPADAIEGMLVV